METEMRQCSHCKEMRNTRRITPLIYLCSECFDKYRLSRINVDKMSEDIDDKVKSKTYLQPSQDWHIGHGLAEHV